MHILAIFLCWQVISDLADAFATHKDKLLSFEAYDISCPIRFNVLLIEDIGVYRLFFKITQFSVGFLDFRQQWVVVLLRIRVDVFTLGFSDLTGVNRDRRATLRMYS